LIHCITKNRYLMILISFLTALGIASFLPGSEDFELYDNVIRIHVVANSDSDYDQDLKLKVRDEIIAVSNILLKDCTDIQSAREIIRNNIPIILETARNAQKEYGVSIDFDKEYYPARNYGSVHLPAGKYHSLRVNLGKAEGKNWWCIIYPTYCLKPSVEKQKITVMDTEAPMTYKVKFKIMDIVGKIAKCLTSY